MHERSFRILAGLASTIFFLGAVYVGVKASTGAFSPKYQLEASFAAAGQGLMSGSDVKIHGVNIGRVKSVRLHEGRALVRMDIDRHHKVPVAAKATIRPKTLFGEKFVDVDPGDAETTGPFLSDEGVIDDTLGGFELEKVLSDAYPILKAVDPAELAVVLDTLAEGGRGQGDKISRQIANWQRLAELQVRHDADLRQFLDDFALLAGELGLRAGDVVAGARDLNEALPALNGRSGELTTVLEQAARLSADLADVLEANQPALEAFAADGGRTIATLYDRRGQIAPLVTGLRQFIQLLAEVGHVDYGNGTKLAAVKYIVGEDCPAGQFDPCPSAASPPGEPPAPAVAPVPGEDGAQPGLPLGLPRLPAPTTGEEAITQLLKGLFG